MGIFNPKSLVEILNKDISQAENEVVKFEKEMSNIQKEILEIRDEVKNLEEQLQNQNTLLEKKVEEINLLSVEKFKVEGAIEMYKAKLASEK